MKGNDTMKLKEACVIGYNAGCGTIKEAILYTEIHCGSIFYWEDITIELYELHKEAADYDENAFIVDVFPEVRELDV